MVTEVKYFDAHTHAQFAAFAGDWRQTIDRALRVGVWLVNVGTQQDTSRRAVEIAAAYPEGVYATVGLHPIHTWKSFHDAKELGDTPAGLGFTSRGEKFDPGVYRELALHPKVVAIGECGLDYYRLEQGTDSEERKAKQRLAFLEQIELAAELQKPLMIHCRQAFTDLIQILKSQSSKLLSSAPGVIHFFSGSPAEARELSNMGFAFTFGGAITFSRTYEETVRMLPAEAILSETDAPYVAPVPYRGTRNEPRYVIEVVKKLAEIRGVTTEEMAEVILRNAKRIFNL